MSPSSLLSMLCQVQPENQSLDKVELDPGDGFLCVLEQNSISLGEKLRGSIFFIADEGSMHSLSFAAEITAALEVEVSRVQSGKLNIVFINIDGEPENTPRFDHAPKTSSRTFFTSEMSFPFAHSKKVLYTITRGTRPHLVHMLPFEITLSEDLLVPVSSELSFKEESKEGSDLVFDKGNSFLSLMRLVYNLRVSVSRANGIAEIASQTKSFFLKKPKLPHPFYGPTMTLNFGEVFKDLKPFQNFFESFYDCCRGSTAENNNGQTKKQTISASKKTGEVHFEQRNKRQSLLKVALPVWTFSKPEHFEFFFFMNIRMNEETQKRLLWRIPCLVSPGPNPITEILLSPSMRVGFLPLRTSPIEVSYQLKAVITIKGKEFEVLNQENVDVEPIYSPLKIIESFELLGSNERTNKLQNCIELPLARIQIGENEIRPSLL